ncbi:hypothetical protein O3P69_000962 [Scylla paramamosain]|uniref:Pyroglutamyl-peptidase I n=1 Tax=Scylla paramamosain TaxID=85552 RepID=A0AAW0USK9_SCYPA
MPKLTIHVGVSGISETLVLEQLAHNTGYMRKDNCGCVPKNGMCYTDGSDVIQSSIRMDLISSTVNKATCVKLPCVKSTDPGRFLCDFTYYLSLVEDKCRSAFIHVPMLHMFTAEEIAAALAIAIKEMSTILLSSLRFSVSKSSTLAWRIPTFSASAFASAGFMFMVTISVLSIATLPCKLTTSFTFEP